MCTILVVYASRMGATREIAEAIADELAQTDHAVTVRSCTDAPDPDGFDAVVIGSAVYARRWMPDATHYLRRQARYLINRPTYLFQSGPCEARDADVSDTSCPRAIRRIVAKFGLPDPVTFSGRLDPSQATGRLTRWVASGSSAGDFRNWDAIRDWAHIIGSELHEYPARQDAHPHHAAATADRIDFTPPAPDRGEALT